MEAWIDLGLGYVRTMVNAPLSRRMRDLSKQAELNGGRKVTS